MKQLLSILFVLTLSAAPCHAQFGSLGKVITGVKAARDAQKAAKKAKEDKGNQKVKDLYNSPEYQKAKEESERQMKEIYEAKREEMEEIGNDSAAYEDYMRNLTGGQSLEEFYKSHGIDKNGKEFQEAQGKAQKMVGFTEDPVFKKIMAEQRQPTMEEATYLNEKYGTEFEYEGMEACNDSVGVFACLADGLKPMGITKFEAITEEKPVPDFGQDEIKQYVKDYIGFLKNPLADKEIVDSVQNYMIYNHRHADEQFKGRAKFTIYSNTQLSLGLGEKTVNDMLDRKLVDFDEPIDPNNIFVFKVHKGIGCRYMPLRYSKISYKESELNNFIPNRLVEDGYIDASINQKISDEQLFRAIDKLEFQFKVGKLLQKRQNDEKFMFTNDVPAAQGVKMSVNTRKINLYVTALDVCFDAEPGEYAFVIRNPEAEALFKEIGGEKQGYFSCDPSVLEQGAFFFTIK